MVIGAGLKGAHRRQDAGSVELHEHLWFLVDGLREADSVVVTVVDRVEKLHEDVSKDVQLLQTLLVNAERLDDVTAFTALSVVFVNLTGHPVM